MTALLLALVAWSVVWFALVRLTRPGPSIPWASEVAYREGRQCYTPCYGGYSAPERCVFPEDHYGECALSSRPAPRRRALVELIDPWSAS